MQDRHHHHLEKLAALKSKLGRFYIHLIIQAIATSTITIFVPIHLLKIGLDLKSVFLFLLAQWSAYSLAAPLAGMVINRIGVKEVILIRSLLMSGSFLLLSLGKNFAPLPIIIYPSAIFLGLGGILYSLSIYALFTKFMHRDHRGKETGRFLGYTKISTALGPFLGGIISLQWGFEILALMVASIMLFSTLPLFFITNNLNHPRFALKSFFFYLRSESKSALYFNIYGIKVFTFFVLLPIVIYLSVGNNFSLGLLFTGAALINLMVNKSIGWIVDRKDSSFLLRASCVLTSLFLLLFASLIGSQAIAYLALFSGIVAIMLDLPFETYILSKAKNKDEPLAYLSFKEFSLIGGRALILLLLIFFSENLEYSFYLSAAATLLIRFF